MSAEPKLLGHEYDGIREYDNPLPGWWSLIFVLSILFAPPYLIYYHGVSGHLVTDFYAAEKAEIEAAKASAPQDEAVTNEALTALASDAAAMATAKEIFGTKCLACHGPEGQGTIGPNLTDEYWLHGGQPVEIYATIMKGVPEKGMISWAPLLKRDEIRALAAFIGTLAGSNPPNPKAPQGEKVSKQ